MKRYVIFVVSFLSGFLQADAAPAVPKKEMERRVSQHGPAPEVPRRHTVSGSSGSSTNGNPVGTGRPLPPPPVPAKKERSMTLKGKAPVVPARARSGSEQGVSQSSKGLEPETSRRHAGKFDPVHDADLLPSGFTVHVDTHEQTKADEEYEKFLESYAHDGEAL